jgi:hypothetical protein
MAAVGCLGRYPTDRTVEREPADDAATPIALRLSIWVAREPDVDLTPDERPLLRLA